MAELNQSSGKTSGRHTKKMPVRVDLTAMVDLAFLLITFFMLTTSLVKPRAMKLVMPVPGPDGFVSEKTTMTICLGKKNQAMYYLGMADKPLTTPKLTGYGVQIRKVIVDMTKQVYASTGKTMMVIIKPAEHSIYENLVNTLDELNITRVPSYAIAAISPKDIELLKDKGIY
ncbi:biopolymer transporter ExbD [Mucilaginibacter sp.]|uniref:ExbD/TolR family protein n=1 Tax=Mucilaginibacter sp. TaxID=1882438 RepID=UPI0025DB6AF9|nr:biopolymer transporter ExbD [Mucilaginibacter sp.]